MEIQNELPKRQITRFFKGILCFVLCFSLLLFSFRSDEVKVNAVVGVDDAAEVFAGAGIAYEVGLVVVAGLVACGLSFATGKDAATCAVSVYEKGNASFKEQAINTANVSAAAGMSLCTWEASGWSDFCNLTTQTFDFSTLTTGTAVVNLPIRTLASIPYTPFNHDTLNWGGDPTFTCSDTTFLVSDSGITFGMSPVFPLSLPHSKDLAIDIQSYPNSDTYYYYMLPSMGLTYVDTCLRGTASKFWYWGDGAFYGAGNRCTLGTSGIGPWATSLFVNGQRLLTNGQITNLVPSDSFTCTTADGVAFPNTGGDVIKGKWSSTQEWWKSLAAAAAAGSLGARLSDKNYYPNIDDVLNPTNKETKLKTDTSVQKEIDKTAAQTRDVQAAPTTSATTSTATSDITGGPTSSSPTTSTSSTTSKLVDGGDTNVSSGINGNASNDLNNLMGLIDTLKAFFAFLAKAFSYLPPEFWILVIGGFVVVIILRVAGR